jgi:hypothetical protein
VVRGDVIRLRWCHVLTKLVRRVFFGSEVDAPKKKKTKTPRSAALGAALGHAARVGARLLRAAARAFAAPTPPPLGRR